MRQSYDSITRNRSAVMRSVATIGLIALTAQLASAGLINLNFTNVAYTNTTETSPATPTGAAGTWNNLTNITANGANSSETDSVAVLLADGSTGPTLTLDSTGNANVWNATGTVFSNTRDFTTAGGVYDVPALYESAMTNGSNGRPTGFRLKGLAPGNYEVFLVPFYRGMVQAGVKTDTSTLAIGLGNDTDARNAGDFTLTSTLANPTVNVATNLTNWVAATDGSTEYNYVGANVTIDSANRWLTFIVNFPASATGGDRPGPGAIQIRSLDRPDVPECSSLLLMLVGTLGVGSAARQRLQASRG